MSEPALRPLDKGLPRLTMYRADRLLAAVQPKPAPAAKPIAPAREIRLLLADARADREAAAR